MHLGIQCRVDTLQSKEIYTPLNRYTINGDIWLFRNAFLIVIGTRPGTGGGLG